MRNDHYPHHRVQELLPLDEIRGSVARLRDGGFRAVLAVGGVPFALRSAAEQEAILAGYRAFLNGLEHPLQLLVRLAPVDVEGYLAGLTGGTGRGPALARLALDHEVFVRGLVRTRTLLDRRCYLVLPADDPPVMTVPLRPSSLFHRRPAERPGGRGRGWETVAGTLEARATALIAGLAAFGVQARRLDQPELTALWAAMLSPARARVQPLAPAARPTAPAALVAVSPTTPTDGRRPANHSNQSHVGGTP